MVWGWLADPDRRRIVFSGTVLNFSIATGLLYSAGKRLGLPFDGSLSASASAGCYCVDLRWCRIHALLQAAAGVGGLVTCGHPLGVGLGAVMGALVGLRRDGDSVCDRRVAALLVAAWSSLVPEKIATLAVPAGL